MYLNPDHVVIVGPVIDPSGAPMLNTTGLILSTGSALHVTGSPSEVSAELEYGTGETLA